MQFGDKLKALRKEKRMTQEEVAQAIGISRRAYMSYEQQNVRPRNREIYTRLAKLLDCDVNYLFVDDDAVTTGKATLEKILSVVGTLPVSMLSSVLYSPRREIDHELKDIERHVATLKGIIFSNMAEKGIVFQQQKPLHIDILENIFDTYLDVKNRQSNEYILRYVYLSDPYASDEFHIQHTGTRLIETLTLLPAYENRKVSIVTDNLSVYKNLLHYKGKISYKGNLSVILADLPMVRLLKEEYLSYYNNETKDEWFIV